MERTAQTGSSLTRKGWSLALLSLATLTASAAVAQTAAVQAPAEQRATHQAPEATPRVGGLQVAIDPVTGRLRQPTPEEIRLLTAEIQHLLSDSAEGLNQTVWPDGTVSVDLAGRFQSVAVATLDAEQGLVTQCLTHPSTAPTAFLAARPTAALEEK